MTPKTALITILSLALALSAAHASGADDTLPRKALKPGSFHLSSFDSELGGRFSKSGEVDTGAVVLRWLDGLTGEQHSADKADLGPGPALNVRWSREQAEQKLVGYCLAGTLASGSDRRLMLSQQVEVSSTSETEQRVQLVAQLLPGSADEASRPLPSLTYRDDETWSLEDERFLLRDGRVVATWVGEAPAVEVVSRPASGGDVAARLVWNFTLQPGESRWVEVMLVGAPAGAAVEEASWRARLRRKSYGSLEDVRRWESMYHGSFGAFACADDRVREAMISGIHVLRSLGNAHYQISTLSDRPFGHPASDAAVEAQILGIFFEYGLNEIGEAYLGKLLDGVYDRASSLPLDRKVAYLHGLARAVRLAGHTSRHGDLAQAIISLMKGEGPEGWAEPWADGAVAVAPWLDPDEVRADFVQVLDRAGMPGSEALPQLAWAESPAAGSTAAEMLEARKALSAGDANAAWEALEKLLNRTTHVGLGSMEPGGTTGGRFAMGMTSLVRAFLVDDHGDDLQIFPGSCGGMVELGVAVKTAWLPTAFGQVQAQGFFTGKNLMGGWVTLRGTFAAARTVMNFPPETVLRKLKSQHGDGTIEIIENNVVQLGLPPGRPLRFTLSIKQNVVAGSDG